MLNPEKIEKIKAIRIPDEDVQDWLKILHEGNFNTEEIDAILAHLNPTFRKIKAPELIQKEFEEFREALAANGTHLDEDQSEYLRRVIEEKFIENLT